MLNGLISPPVSPQSYTVGPLVDAVSNYELEADEMMRKGVELTPELWLVKVRRYSTCATGPILIDDLQLLMGGIDSSYDEKDE